MGTVVGVALYCRGRMVVQYMARVHGFFLGNKDEICFLRTGYSTVANDGLECQNTTCITRAPRIDLMGGNRSLPLLVNTVDNYLKSQIRRSEGINRY